MATDGKDAPLHCKGTLWIAGWRVVIASRIFAYRLYHLPTSCCNHRQSLESKGKGKKTGKGGGQAMYSGQRTTWYNTHGTLLSNAYTNQITSPDGPVRDTGKTL